ncbi:hypothetical protein FOCC_FOCC014699 [Frankliniella occidentalis]|uniref:Uncharacterized protein LOC127751040 n=1 Tax=Frankliniella occidentalis TaxID=133901 RepID=A0A9C6X6F3_FRAOC|nr:uncharacterized protein LOC127751040 [Frankliniella occidentalis]KAE8739807.1 hypothetical protein FOCC_FOCC014699 [Frankliniella occidentalis]
MPRSKPRKSVKGTFSPEAMKAALRQVREGKCVRTAATLNKVSHMTLKRYVKLNKNVENLDFAVVSPNYSTRQIFTKDMEDSLKGYIIECSQMGYGLTAPEIKRFAVQFTEVNKVPNIPDSWKENQAAGQDWFRGFMSRHPDLSARKPEQCSIARAMAFNKVNISNYFDKLELVLKRHPNFANGSRVYNLDETGSTTVGDMKKAKVITEKGVKQVHQIKSAERGTLVTTCCIICGNGTMVPLVMIFPRAKFTNNMLINGYPGTLGLATKNGWMITEKFLQVIQHFVAKTNSSPENPTLLILDNVASHLSIEAINLCRASGVTLFTLPPHTTHKTQPLDGPYQAAYSRAYNSWTLAHPAQVCTIYDVAGLVNEALCKVATPTNIFSAFRATGIYPFNRDIFSDLEFVPSSVTENPAPTATVNEEEQNDSEEVDNPGGEAEVENSQLVTPRKVRPLPKAKPKETTRKPREKGRCRVATDTPEKREIEAKAAEKRQKEAEKDKKKRERTQKNLEKVIEGHSKTNKKKTAKKQTKTARKKKAPTPPSTESESDLLEEESEEEMWEGDENYEDDESEDRELFKPLEKSPEEGDHIIVVFRGKEDKYYVGKVLKEKDEDGDLEVSYYRQCTKRVYSFVLPNIPDLKSVHINDIVAILPQPHVGGTTRQRNIISFPFDFTRIRLG